MRVIDKIEKMENKRYFNHDLTLYRSWLDEKLPEHIHLKNIQIAGTNGKGSTSKWLSLFLKKAGYKVGLFTSPHLIMHTERIQINNENISLEDWERIYDQYEPFFDEKEMNMFEMDLWMAIVYFLEKKVDYCIFEVGLGGSRDATTALDYLVTAITNIGLDHQEILGSTVEEIAYTKAGIFKPNVPALTTETKGSCLKVMKEMAEKKSTTLEVITPKNVDLYPHPAYQQMNYLLAEHILKVLNIPLINKEKVIKNFSWQGRGMILQKKPLRMVDGAHNPHGIEALVSSFPNFRGVIYFSVLKEKDAKTMLEMLETLNSEIILVSFDSYRLYPLEQLGYPVISMDEMFEQLKTEEKDCLLCGSLYFVGDVLKYWGKENV